MPNKFKFDRVIANTEVMKRTLPVMLGNQGTNFFIRTFDRQGFDDNGLQKWKEVKRRQQGTPEYKYPKNKGLSRRTRPIEVGETGRLRRAVSASLRQATFNRIRWVVPLKYAAIQNEGGTIHKSERQSVIHFKNVKIKKGSKATRAVFSRQRGAHFAQKVTIGAHDIVLPARPFMKHSRTLEKEQFALISKVTAGVFKP